MNENVLLMTKLTKPFNNAEFMLFKQHPSEKLIIDIINLLPVIYYNHL